MKSLKNWMGWTSRPRPTLLYEALLLLRFGVIGLGATGIHIGLVWTLLRHTTLPVLLANAMAFATAFCFSFAGNYLWTFQSPGNPGKAMRRFLVISGSAFLINSFLLSGILRYGVFSAWEATLLSSCAVPVITFLASRIWGFEKQTG